MLSVYPTYEIERPGMCLPLPGEGAADRFATGCRCRVCEPSTPTLTCIEGPRFLTLVRSHSKCTVVFLAIVLIVDGGARSTQAVQGGTKTQFYLRFGFDNRESRHDFRESILILAVLLNEGQIGGKHFGCAPLFT